MSRKTVIFTLLAVLWCGFIFFLSSENSEQSSQRSDGIIRTVCETFNSDFKDYSPQRQDEIISDLSFWVRKGAHFSAYAVLGALAFQAFCFMKKKLLRSTAAVGAACLYAVSDEIHQSFSPGRSAELRDILIDTCGAAIAVCISLLVIRLIDRKRNTKAGTVSA